MSDVREAIARRVARELDDGDYVNLGIGLPTLVANYVRPTSPSPCIPRMACLASAPTRMTTTLMQI